MDESTTKRRNKVDVSCIDSYIYNNVKYNVLCKKKCFLKKNNVNPNSANFRLNNFERSNIFASYYR